LLRGGRTSGRDPPPPAYEPAYAGTIVSASEPQQAAANEPPLPPLHAASLALAPANLT
jgi:hypothetical protein